MHYLCIISAGYPYNGNPIAYPFVRLFAHAVARQGVRTTVIAPLPVHRTWRSKDPFQSNEQIGNKVTIDVFRPRYVSASDRQIWKWNTAQIGLESFCRATRRVLRHHVPCRPDALYGHFLYPSGATVVRLGAEMDIPAFPMVGEGLLTTVDAFGRIRARRHLSAATAFMANSSCLGTLLQQDLEIAREKIGIFPNGIDHQVFYHRDKAAMRRRLGLPQDGFLVICVGHQDLQKGPVRVGEAIQGLEGVSGVFLGSGPNPPQAENCIVSKPVPHDEVPEWLSAADVFVLPSTYEGCCNAALEAMSCGLPVISSKGAFNDDILNPDVSIRTDPLDVPAIRRAIVRLRDDTDLREKMGKAALKWSENFDADIRARRILEFMQERIRLEERDGRI
jgi:glycosyltransferase involved in cell wall biosynthesis